MRSSTELMPMLVTAFIAAVGIGSLILMNIDSKANIHGVGVTMISAYLVEKAGGDHAAARALRAPISCLAPGAQTTADA
jgi:hypothetical protein